MKKQRTLSRQMCCSRCQRPTPDGDLVGIQSDDLLSRWAHCLCVKCCHEMGAIVTDDCVLETPEFRVSLYELDPVLLPIIDKTMLKCGKSDIEVWSKVRKHERVTKLVQEIAKIVENTDDILTVLATFRPETTILAVVDARDVPTLDDGEEIPEGTE